MPFHVFLSQSVSEITGGLNEWKIAKDVVLAILTLLSICLVWQQHRSTRLFNSLVGATVVYGLLLLGVWALHPHIYRTSAVLGVTYDLRLFCYTILGFSAVLLTKVNVRFVFKVVLLVCTTVSVLGIIQYLLPADFLTHLGYSVARGTRPNFFIDNNPEFPRIMSTIRDPNSLGAYLLVPIALLVAMLLRARNQRRRILFGAALSVQLLALCLTFSRSAWLGGVIVVGLVVWWQYRHWFWKTMRGYWPVVTVMILLLGGVAYSQRHNPVLTHQTKLQVGRYDSNQLHAYLVQQNVKAILHDPLGHGPGTAGLASIHNPGGVNLTENYYLQVGYELGVVGLLLFIGMQLFLCIRLWSQRHGYLGLILLVSFWAYVLINMLLQEWDNEAVAAQWWLLAGLALGLPSLQTSHSKPIR